MAKNSPKNLADPTQLKPVDKQNGLLLGITTAATLWIATVFGLCLGGGQLILGSVSTALGFMVLYGMRRFERRTEHYQPADLSLTIAGNQLSPRDLRARLEQVRFHIKSISVLNDLSEHCKTYDCQVRWSSSNGNADIPEVLTELECLPGLVRLDWKSTGTVPN